MRMYCLLGDILRERGLTVRWLKRRSGVCADTIRALLSNRWLGVRRESLCHIAEALDLTSPAQLFAFYRDDVFGSLWLHRQVTIHLGSSVFSPWQQSGRGRPRGASGRQQLGRWDFRALNHLHDALRKLIPGIRFDFKDHLGPDPAVSESVDRVFAGGDHIILGSPLINQFAEEVVCRAHGVTPYSPDTRSAFEFAFKWKSSRAVDSSFGFQGLGGEFGIVALPSGRIVAPYTHVTSGQGKDCAIVMVHRIFRRPADRTHGIDDEFVVVAILGYSGCGTLAAAQLLTQDPAVAAALYPERGESPRMGVVSVTYSRQPGAAEDDDNRQIESATLVTREETKKTALPARSATTGGHTRRSRRG